MANTQHLSAHYDDRANRLADGFQNGTFPKFPVDRNMIRMVVDLVGDRLRLLDSMRCWASDEAVADLGCEAFCVDAAEKLIELGRTAYPGLAFTFGDLRALPYPDQDFDASSVARGLKRMSVSERFPGGAEPGDQGGDGPVLGYVTPATK